MSVERALRFLGGLLCALIATFPVCPEVSSAELIHGGYATTTNACASCHDVHEGAGWRLLPWEDPTEACVSCHLDGGAGPQIGGGESPAHRCFVTTSIPCTKDQSELGRDGAADELDCLDCHDSAPHGAGEGAYGHLTKSADAIAFCLQCHDENDGRVPNGTARTSQNTHVMIATYAAYTEHGSTVATHADDSANSESCFHCHTDTTDLPHSGTFKLLKPGAVAKGLDTVCRDCHGASVGVSY